MNNDWVVNVQVLICFKPFVCLSLFYLFVCIWDPTAPGFYHYLYVIDVHGLYSTLHNIGTPGKDE